MTIVTARDRVARLSMVMAAIIVSGFPTLLVLYSPDFLPGVPMYIASGQRLGPSPPSSPQARFDAPGTARWRLC